MEYKKFLQKETFGLTKFGVELNLAIEREIGREEAYKICGHIDEIIKTIQYHDELNNKDLQDGIKERKRRLLECFAPEPIFVEEIKNEYWPNTTEPWYMVTTGKGRIKIGWRKRVISIDWSASTIKKFGKSLFGNEETTKDDYLVHAWGYEKAKEYISMLMA